MISETLPRAIKCLFNNKFCVKDKTAKKEMKNKNEKKNESKMPKQLL